MENKYADQPAFPMLESWNDEHPEILVNRESGLTKREYFAAMAMQGMLANSEIIRIMTNAKIRPDEQAKFLSVAAIEQGDEILNQLSK